tara:strand:+ start:1033 stop:1377 length:345 start_codon:yes stop_codon:yes gene_type:complete
MALTLTLANQQIQDSVQKGDIIYYATPSSNAITQGNLIRLGVVDSIDFDESKIVVDPLYSSTTPSNGDYILFSKDNRANMMTLIGYYAEIKFINKSTSEAELFAVSSDVFESSK